MSSNEPCWQGYSLLSPPRIEKLGKYTKQQEREGGKEGRREKCFNKRAKKTSPTCRILLKHPLMIFVNHPVGRLHRTSQIMHTVELRILRATQIKEALIFQQIFTRGRQAPQFHHETLARLRALEPRCLEVTRPMWWFFRWILQQFYKVTVGCDLYFKAIGRSSPKGIQEKEKESADRNRLPSSNISIPFHHKTQA